MSMYSLLRHKVDYHSVPNFKENREEMIEWCREQFGSRNWALYRFLWRFRYKKDYAYFLLRWK